jgi:hypothetical protein
MTRVDAAGRSRWLDRGIGEEPKRRADSFGYLRGEALTSRGSVKRAPRMRGTGMLQQNQSRKRSHKIARQLAVSVFVRPATRSSLQEQSEYFE